MGLQDVVSLVFAYFMIRQGLFQLMRQGHTFQLLFRIEPAVGKIGNVRVHSSLFVQCADEVCASCCPLCEDEPLEEGVGAGGEVDSFQCFVFDNHFRITLLHNRRQLFVVADQYELPDCPLFPVPACQQPDNIRF